MSRKTINNTILALIVLFTIMSLIISVQSIDSTAISSRYLELIVYALVTAFALILSVPLSRSELSIAHAIGLLALLSLPANVIPAMTIAIFFGGLVGGLIRARVSRNRRLGNVHFFITTIHITARVTLAYFVASQIYTQVFNASLPINDSADISNNALPLAVAIIVYLAMYLASYLIQVRTYERVRSVLPSNAISLAIILLLPVPFALIGASVARTDESVLFFSITMLGVVLIIFGLFALNRSQQRLWRQLEEMRSISVATQAMRGNLDLSGLLRTTYVQVSQLMEIENFTVALYNEIEMKMTFPLVIRHGNEITVTDSHGLPSDYPLIEHMMDSGHGLLIEKNVADYARSLGLRAPDKPIQSWVGVPLVSGDKTFGAFVVQSYDNRRFDDDDLRVLNIIVASTSIAIENARLYRQKSIRAEQLATLNRVTALLTGTLAPKEVLDTVISSASTISEANAVAVFLYSSDDEDSLTLARSAGMTDAFLLKPSLPLLGSTLEERVVEDFTTPQSLLVQNLDDTEILPVKQRLIDEGKRAFIEQPLVFSGKKLGVLVFYYDKPQSYHSEQVNMIQAFATQAAQAINNAQRFASADAALEQRVEQLYVLAAMGRVLNASMEADKIYEIVLSYATDATKAPRGFIAIYRQSGKLVVPSQRGYPEDMFADADFLEQGLSGRVLTAGQALRIGDTRLETGYLPLTPKTRSALVTPIMKGRQILGIIMLESDTPGTFSEADGHFVAQISNQAVIAVDNTMLFQRIREARDNMQVILDAMQEGIILIDEHNVVALANPNITLVELNADDILEQDVNHLLDSDGLNFAEKLGFANKEALRKLVKNIGERWESYSLHDYEIRNEEFGVRYIQRQIIPVRDEDRHISGIMLVFYNKSEERELAAARESLSQMIVHDLRSPLTAVTTSLRLLQELVPKDTNFAPLVEKTTATSRRAIRKVLTRVDSLLDISKMESGLMRLDREPSSIKHIVDSVRVELSPLADELEVELISNIDDDLPLVNIDSDKIERMIINLVDNALKYSPPDSIVSIDAAVVDSDFMRIEVTDSGPGIPDDYKQRLFDRFVQIEGRKTVRGGVGLGLTFCKLVTEAHGGDIWVADNPAGGSVFIATLPIAKITEPIE